MARKTYHHLQVGDEVTLEHFSWLTPDGSEAILGTTSGVVIKVLKSRVAIQYTESSDGNICRVVVEQFSRQGGQRWGAGDEDWRIAPKHAKPKTK